MSNFLRISMESLKATTTFVLHGTMLINISIVVFVVLLFSNSLSSQSYCSPNTALESTINFWDWTVDETFTFFLDGINGPTPVQSPFYISGRVIPPNVSVYSLVPESDQDFHPEDGWELLYRSFGTRTRKVPAASFAIYNRYEGVIRNFVYVPNADDDFNMAANAIGLRNENPNVYDGNMLMAFSDSPIKSLEDYSPNTTDGFNILNELEVGSLGEGSGTWTVSEAAVMYDPCVCEYRSIIQNQVVAQSISSITLDGTSTGTSEAIYDNGVSSSPFLAGSKGAKTFEEFFKKFKSTSGAKSEASAKGTRIFGNLTSIFGGTGSILSILDFFVSGGKTSKPSLIGYADNHEYNFTGSFVFTTPVVTDGTYAPGSSQSGLPPGLQPVYNNPLGVISIVEAPVVDVSTYRYIDSNPFDDCLDSERTEKEYQFDASSFSYLINTDAGIEGTPLSIKAAIKFPNCVLETNAFTDLDNLIRDSSDPSVFTTPMMDLDCLEDYTIALREERYQQPSSRGGCDWSSEGGWCDDGLELLVQFRLMPSNPVPGQDPIEIILTLDVNERSVQIGSIPDNAFADNSSAINCATGVIGPLKGISPNMYQSALDNICDPSGNIYDPSFVSSRGSYEDDINIENDVIARKLEHKSKDPDLLVADPDANLVVAYPNPTESQVWLNIPSSFADIDDNIQISIFDVEGRLLSTLQIPYQGFEERMSLGKYPAGRYVVKTLNLTTDATSVSIINKN